MSTLRKTVRKSLSAALGVAGFELLRLGRTEYVRSFLPLRRTLEEARKAKLSVGDYIDSKYQVPGATQGTIDELVKLGVFRQNADRVCEVGPGSGRYLEKVLELCEPRSYEIYETQQEWSDWLEKTYHIKAHHADGKSLGHTATESVDLIHAHKVFVYLPSIVSCQYFGEMIRVARPGGKIVFDIVSEGCLDDPTIEKWIARGSYYASIMPRQFVIDFFAARDCSLLCSLFAPLGAGRSEYLVFAKAAAKP